MQQPRYTLRVTAHGKPGYYSSDSITGIIWALLKHRISHLTTQRRWID